LKSNNPNTTTHSAEIHVKIKRLFQIQNFKIMMYPCFVFCVVLMFILIQLEIKLILEILKVELLLQLSISH